MDDDSRVLEYYENEWNIAGTKPGKSSHTDQMAGMITGPTEEELRSTVYQATIAAWIAGYLLH